MELDFRWRLRFVELQLVSYERTELSTFSLLLYHRSAPSLSPKDATASTRCTSRQ